MDHLDQLETRELEESLVRKGHQVSKADQDHEVELEDQGKRENRYNKKDCIQFIQSAKIKFRDHLDSREMLDLMA